MSTDVHVGKDGWLFLIGGTNAVGTLYDRGAALLPDAKLEQWARLIGERARRLETLGIQYVHVSVPEKLTIYDNRFSDPSVVDWRLSPASRLGEMLQHSEYAHVWLDLIGPLRAARDGEPLYVKTDSHWNASGCFIAYKAICERIGIEPEPDLLSRPYLDFGAYLDLGSKLEPPVPEVFKFYNFARNAQRTYTNPIADYLDAIAHDAVMHVGSHVAFSNGAPDAAPLKILIFGDSYASQRADALTGMLAETARAVEFIWSSNLDWHYIERTRPDVVIYEIVERFMTVLPKDNLNLRWVVARQGLRAKWLKYRARKRAARRAKLV
jgi:alginate O-acetyltransferase complex protein AlgJ